MNDLTGASGQPTAGGANRYESDGTVALQGAAMQSVTACRLRVSLIALAFGALFTVLGARLVDVTLINASLEPTLARTARASDGSAAIGQPHMSRASIVDRNGALLATNINAASLYANPSIMPNPAEAAEALHGILPDIELNRLRRKLRAKSQFVWLKRGLTPRQQAAVNGLGIPGLEFQEEERRIYPYGGLAAHVLGFTSIDNKGIAGVEKTLDERLSSPKSGDDQLSLSVDIRLQHVVREELDEARQTFQAIGAAGLVLDVASGEVLALVSLPDFDPNLPSDATKDALFNRVTLGVYEMGSTFKTFTTAMALDSGAVRMTGGYDATKPLKAARFVIRDYHAKRRWLSVPEIYMYSSNIGAAKMAAAVGTAGQQEFLGRLGLLKKPSIELPEVSAPILPSQWHEIETLTIAFGHGLSVSILQMASAAATVVNGGMQVQPTLLLGAGVNAQRRVLDRKTSDQVRRLMRLVVAQGTGRRAAAPGYVVGGKTGTAEKAKAGGYDRKALITSFVGAFPMTAPRYVVVAMLDEPRGNKKTKGRATASLTAAPVVGRIVSRIAPLLGVAPVDEESDAVREKLKVRINSKDPRVATF